MGSRSRKRTARRQPAQHRRRLHLERLEDRLVLSATFPYSSVSPTWFAASSAGQGSTENQSLPPSGQTQDWIIRLTAAAAEQAGGVEGAASLLSQLPIDVVRGLGLPGQLLVTSAVGAANVVDALDASPLIAAFQQNSLIGGATLPNDPRINGLDQYGLFNVGQDEGTTDSDIDADLAWDITTGSASVVTAVIDSGIYYTHPDLAANIWTNPGETAGDNLDNDNNGFIDDVYGWDFHNDDNDPLDDHGHGTHVAGTIGAVGNNNTGVTGVNWATRLMALKFLDEHNVGSVADAVAAINYATMMRTRAVNPVSVRVINASWGGSGVDDQALEDAIAASGTADILFVSAAGNGDVFGRGQNIDELPFFPASFGLDNMLVVAATDRHDQLTTFSNYGVNTVDIGAPGLSVLSTDLFIDNGLTQTDYRTRTGTSMAAPHVAGTAALVWASAPSATVSEVRDAILAGGELKAGLSGKIASGKRLNAYGTLLALPPQAVVTSALDVTSVGGTSYQFTVQLTSNTPINAASIGTGDFVVRRQNTSGSDLVATLVTATPANFDKLWTVTYQITPPGGTWDALDTGLYEISLVAGQIVDTNGVVSRPKVVDTFLVDLTSLGVFRPNVFGDGADASVGDGLAKTPGDVTTLRAAIQEANLVGGAGGTVILAPGTYTLAIAGAEEDVAVTGDLDITGHVTIASDGSGPVIIDAVGIDRVFDVHPGATLVIGDVTITGGSVFGKEGGGIRNEGTLTVTNSTIHNNFTDQYGGGIYNAGMLTIDTTTLEGNQSAFGGGVYNAEGATADVENTTINGNSADAPNPQGGIYDILGGEYQLGSAATSTYYAAISATGLGDAFVTWEYRAPFDVLGRFVSANSPLTTLSEFTLNSPPVEAIRTGNAIDASGRAIVVWQATGVDAEATGIQARLYDASTDVAGSSGSGILLVNTTQGGSQSDAEVAANASGAAVAVWRSTEGGFVYIRARRLTTSGAFLGDDFYVNATDAGDKQYPDVAVRPDGSFIVVWQSDHDGTWSSFARIYDSNGVPLTGEMLVQQTAAGSQSLPRVDADESGFVVVWNDQTLEADAGGVYARAFDSQGIPLSDDFRLSENPAGNQHYPRVLRLADGGFFAVWDSAGPADNSYDVHGQQFSEAGHRVGSEIIINQTRAGDQIRGVVAQLSTNELIVAWEDLAGSAIYGITVSATFHDGGGIYNAGTLNATNVTISGNEAANQGGGVFNADGATATIHSSTVSSNGASVEDNGLVSFFQADGTPVDSAGGNNGVLFGSTTYSQGKIGQAFEFDASPGTSVEVPGLSSMQAQTLTVEAWVYADSVGSTNDFQGPVIVSKDGNGIDIEPSFVVLGPGNTSRFQFGVKFTDATLTYFQSSNTFAFGVWHHVALTWDGASVRGYVNGNLEGVALVGGSKQINYVPTSPVSIGSHLGAGGRRYDGKIDEVRLYDRALTGTEIQNAAFLGKGGGIANSINGVVNLRNTVVASNTTSVGRVAPDVRGAFASQGGNMIGDVGAATGFTQPTDQVGSAVTPLDPKLGPLAENGGPTRTHHPAADSPAIDAGVATGAPATDQRGVLRPADGDNDGMAEFDTGAVERYYASISGRKFQDQNANGIQDVGESGIANWTMYLDLNSNSQLDAGEPTDITNSQGDYSFAQLAPGNYTVAEVSPFGWTRTYTSTNYVSDVQDGVSGVSGLTSVHELAISPDGKHAYAINSDPAGADTIVTFARNATTGALTFVAALTNGQGGISGLEGEGHVLASPDGKHVYAIGTNETPIPSIVVFARNATTGVLTFVEKRTTATSPNDLAISANGQHLYTLGSSGSALLSFLRNSTTGVLTPLPSRAQTGPALVISSDGSHVYTTNGSNLVTYSRNTGTGVLGTSPLFTFSNGQPAPGGGTADGLTFVIDLAISPDGAYLYTLAMGDMLSIEPSIAVYQRNASTGALAFIEKISRGLPDSLGAVVDGLSGARSLAISPSGDRLYATGDSGADEEDSLAVFRRDAATGRLSYQHVLKQFGEDGAANFLLTLTNPDGVAVSPDGRDIYVVARDGSISVGAITQFARDGQGVDQKTLLVGDERTGVNFSSFAAPGEIRGAVYNDVNQNGARDQDEYSLGGVTVYLDKDGSNTVTPGDVTTTTSVLGAYAFSNLLAPANYSIRVALLNGQTVTYPSAVDNREWNVALDPDEIFVAADFLIHNALSGQGTSQISGFVWQDLDDDGFYQGNEPYLAGRQVYLDVNDNGAYDVGVDIPAGQLTSATGNYFFVGLGATNAAVRVVANPGELTSTPVGNSFIKQSLTTGANPLGLVTADFNNDGRPDLASVDGNSDKVSVRLQLAGGGFATRVEYDVRDQPTGLAVGLFDNNSSLDIAVVHTSFSANKVVFLLNNGNGTFTKSAYEIALGAGYSTVVAADFDLANRDDLAVAVDNGSSDKIYILRNNGGAGFGFTETQQIAMAAASPLSMATGLVDAGNYPDLVLGNYDGDSVQVIRNQSGGSLTALTAVTVGDGPSSVTLSDMDNDGDRDVVVTSIRANTVTVLNGNGAGGLTLTTPIPVGQGPRSIAVADIDDDNDLDLVVGNVTTNDVVILRKEASGYGFPESSGLASFASLVDPGVKQVLAIHLDSDGIIDLAAVRGDANNGSLEVLFNALAPGSHRLALTGSNQVPNQNFGITAAAAPIPGDYDRNGAVEQADHTFWNTNFGATSGTGLQADGNGNGTVDAADYTVWRNNLGAGAGAGGAASVAGPSAASASVAVEDHSSPTTNGTEALDLALAAYGWFPTSPAEELSFDEIVPNSPTSSESTGTDQALLLVLAGARHGNRDWSSDSFASDTLSADDPVERADGQLPELAFALADLL